MKEARVRQYTKEQVRQENKEATGKRGRKDDRLIKGRSKGGPQEERGKKRKETKEINGVDAEEEDENINDNNITLSHRQQANEETCARLIQKRKYFTLFYFI